jgi:hypothetical protein
MVMRLFKTEMQKKTVPARLQKMDTPSLYNWMESTIMGLGASFDKFRYHDKGKEELVEHIEALNAVWQELENRVAKD